MHKSLVTFNYVHLLNFLDPRLQVSSPCQCTEKLKKVVAFLVQLQKVNERDCDDIINFQATWILFLWLGLISFAISTLSVQEGIATTQNN